jgi:carbamate kinase
VEADVLALLTDVDGVVRGYRTEHARLIERARPEELAAMPFDAGSMGPKVRAACRFVERTGKRAAIGALDRALDVVRGAAGTQIA